MAVTDPVEEITIRVNGERRTVPPGTSVGELLRLLDVDARQVAVERNRTVVRREALGTTVLEDGDRLEIVTFVGGG